MHPELNQAFAEEMAQARADCRQQSFAESFGHLERTHVLQDRYGDTNCGISTPAEVRGEGEIPDHRIGA